MIRMLLLVHKAAQQAHRDATASLRQALMRDYRLQTGLEELLGHLRLQLEQVGHRRLVLRGHLEVRGQHEVGAAGLAGQAEVQRGVQLGVRGLRVLELVDVVVRKILLEGATDIVRLLSILLVVTTGSPFACSSTPPIVAVVCLARH